GAKGTGRPSRATAARGGRSPAASSTGRSGERRTPAQAATTTTTAPVETTTTTEPAAAGSGTSATTTTLPGSGLAVSGAGQIAVGPTTPRTGGLPLAVPGLLLIVAGLGLRRL